MKAKLNLHKINFELRTNFENLKIKNEKMNLLELHPQ